MRAKRVHHTRRASMTLNGKPVRVELVVRCGRKVERYPFGPFSRSDQQTFGRIVLAQAMAAIVVRASDRRTRARGH